MAAVAPTDPDIVQRVGVRRRVSVRVVVLAVPEPEFELQQGKGVREGQGNLQRPAQRSVGVVTGTRGNVRGIDVQVVNPVFRRVHHVHGAGNRKGNRLRRRRCLIGRVCENVGVDVGLAVPVVILGKDIQGRESRVTVVVVAPASARAGRLDVVIAEGVLRVRVATVRVGSGMVLADPKRKSRVAGHHAAGGAHDRLARRRGRRRERRGDLQRDRLRRCRRSRLPRAGECQQQGTG